jgi:hypothetical protein
MDGDGGRADVAPVDGAEASVRAFSIAVANPPRTCAGAWAGAGLGAAPIRGRPRFEAGERDTMPRSDATWAMVYAEAFTPFAVSAYAIRFHDQPAARACTIFSPKRSNVCAITDERGFVASNSSSPAPTSAHTLSATSPTCFPLVFARVSIPPQLPEPLRDVNRATPRNCVLSVKTLILPRQRSFHAHHIRYALCYSGFVVVAITALPTTLLSVKLNANAKSLNYTNTS